MYGHGIYLDEGASGITITQNWVHDTYAALYLLRARSVTQNAQFAPDSGFICDDRAFVVSMSRYLQHYGVNNSLTSNVWARATGKCIDFKAVDGTQNHYCPGHVWHCAYRYQPCGFNFSSNILLSGKDDNSFWHQPAEGYCNTTTVNNVYWNASSSNGQLSPTQVRDTMHAALALNNR
jgi:hypothetical protein